MFSAPVALFLLSTLISLGPLAAAAPAAVSSEKPTPTALNLKAQETGFPFDLTPNLPRASSTVTSLTTVPGSCLMYMTGASPECTAGMAAVNVTLDDCGSQWTICRCNNANMSLDDIVDRFSRVPVGLRRYVGTVVVSPDSEPHAYTLTTGDIHLFGPDIEMETWLHESTHAYDYASGTPRSGSSEWLQAIGNDTCAPDSYSLTNAVEDFAQVSVLKFYALAHGGSLPPGFDSDCMKNQLHFMDTLPLFNSTNLFGNTCEIYDGSDGWDLDLSSKHNLAPAALNMTKTFPLPVVNSESTISGFQKVVSTSDTEPAVTATAVLGHNNAGTSASLGRVSRSLLGLLLSSLAASVVF